MLYLTKTVLFHPIKAPLRGKYFDEVVVTHRLSSYSARLDSLATLSGAALDREVKQLSRDLRKESEAAKEQPTKLSDYSPWLATTSFAGQSVDMFGQYVGFVKPYEQNTMVKIVSFEPSVSSSRHLVRNHLSPYSLKHAFPHRLHIKDFQSKNLSGRP